MPEVENGEHNITIITFARMLYEALSASDSLTNALYIHGSKSISRLVMSGLWCHYRRSKGPKKALSELVDIKSEVLLTSTTSIKETYNSRVAKKTQPIERKSVQTTGNH